MIKKCVMGKNVTICDGVQIDENVTIGDNCFIGHNSVIRSGVVLGKNVVVGHLVVIEKGTRVGDSTTIQSQCHITAFANIGDHVYFGPCATCINEWKITKWRNDVLPQILKGPVIGRCARIGTRSLIMPGVNIGENAMIGAGSTVTKDVGPREIWRGPQAVKVGMVPEEELI